MYFTASLHDVERDHTEEAPRRNGGQAGRRQTHANHRDAGGLDLRLEILHDGAKHLVDVARGDLARLGPAAGEVEDLGDHVVGGASMFESMR